MRAPSWLPALALAGVLGGCGASSGPAGDVAAPGTPLTEPPARATPGGNAGSAGPPSGGVARNAVE